MTEETAVDIFDPRPVEVHVDDSNLRAHAFLVTGWTGEPMNVAPEEHDALAWFGPGELADLRLAHPRTVTSTLLCGSADDQAEPGVTGRQLRMTPLGSTRCLMSRSRANV